MSKLKKYSDQNVYDASMERIKTIFDNFEKIYLSFSGGKDSGVMLNLVLQYMEENNIDRKLGIMVLDNEANYTLSLEFMHRILEKHQDKLDIHWCCLPVTLPCTVSSYEIDWQCWGENDKDRWIRPLPDKPYIKTLHNNPYPFFKENMNYDEFWDAFATWYADGKSCANLVGIRTDESLNRFRAILNQNKETFDGHNWTRKNGEHVFNCYPIYDWKTDDIWTANAKFAWDYNKLYDVFYRANLPVATMRVASPFMSESKSSLNMYRVIDPQVWARLCARVGGANFVATYGKQLAYSDFKLPNGHTWKTFVKFLLETLPPSSAENFKSRLVQSIHFWASTGRGLGEHIIAALRDLDIPHEVKGYTPHGSKTLRRVTVSPYPDHMDFLKRDKASVASWKRFAITILKNDHTCKYLGLQPNKDQLARMKMIKKKYEYLTIKGEKRGDKKEANSETGGVS